MIYANAGNLCGSAPINITAATPDLWTAGSARYNSGTIINNLGQALRPADGGVAAECTSCLECIAVCPAQDALAVRVAAPVVGRSKRIPAWAVAAGVAIIFISLVGYAKWSGHWDTHLPSQVYFPLVPLANEQQHRF